MRFWAAKIALSWKLKSLSFENFGDIQVEEIAVQNCLKTSGNDGDQIVETCGKFYWKKLQCTDNLYSPASEESREVANSIKRNTHAHTPYICHQFLQYFILKQQWILISKLIKDRFNNWTKLTNMTILTSNDYIAGNGSLFYC